MASIKAIIAKFLNIPIVRFLVTVGQRFGRHNGGIYAGALSFFMLLAFVPMIITGIAVLAAFVHADEALRVVEHMVHNLVPAGGASLELDHLIKERLHPENIIRDLQAKHGIAGILGFLSLVWASMQIFINASAAMNDAWEVQEKRNWFVLRGLALALMVAAGVLLTITLFLSGAPNAIIKFNLPVIHHLPIPMSVLTPVFEILAVIVNALLYVLVYKFLPNARVPWRAALVGGLTASIAWEVVKKGVAAWLLRPNHSIYGGLADLILFVLWIYYSMMILLIGAEVASVYAKEQETGHLAHESAHADGRTKPVRHGRHVRRSAVGETERARR